MKATVPLVLNSKKFPLEGVQEKLYKEKDAKIKEHIKILIVKHINFKYSEFHVIYLNYNNIKSQ